MLAVKLGKRNKAKGRSDKNKAKPENLRNSLPVHVVKMSKDGQNRVIPRLFDKVN